MGSFQRDGAGSGPALTFSRVVCLLYLAVYKKRIYWSEVNFEFYTPAQIWHFQSGAQESDVCSVSQQI